MEYTLSVKETGNKAARFHYVVTDENGQVISERKSNREYVACTANGNQYFGRLDLIGKGDHGKWLKTLPGWIANSPTEADRERNQAWLNELNKIAYLKK